MASTSGAAALSATDAGEPPAGRLRWSRDRLLALVGFVRSSVGGCRLSDDRSPPQAQWLPPPSWNGPRGERGAEALGSAVDLAPPRPGPLAKPLTVAHYRTLARQVAYERQVALLGAHDLARDAWFTGCAPAASGAQGRG